ncbi:MAG: phosphatase domain-containing protein [Bdellovibrionia bacterium]
MFAMMLISSPLVKAEERPYVISGFDDVLRQAENTGLVKAALKIVEKDKTFAGMPELYQGLSREEKTPEKFSIVSAISSLFDGRISEFLADSGFPENDRYLRNWLTEWSIEDFKVSRIEKIIKNKPQRKFIVIFDNSDPSLALSEKLHEKFSENILAIYLRQVVEKPLPSSATPFVSAFDIAVNEFVADRMTSDEVLKVGSAIVQESRSELILPSYALCSTSFTHCEDVPVILQNACQQVRARIEEICRQRSS